MCGEVWYVVPVLQDGTFSVTGPTSCRLDMSVLVKASQTPTAASPSGSCRCGSYRPPTISLFPDSIIRFQFSTLITFQSCLPVIRSRSAWKELRLFLGLKYRHIYKSSLNLVSEFNFPTWKLYIQIGFQRIPLCQPETLPVFLPFCPFTPSCTRPHCLFLSLGLIKVTPM